MAERSTRTGAGQVVAGEAPGTVATAQTSAAGETRSVTEMFRAGRDQAIDEARVMVRDLADTQRRKAAEGMLGIAQALRRTATNLQPENVTMARYTDMAAKRLDEAAQYLRQTNWNDIVTGAEKMARRQPAWFIGGAAVAGFMIARALKATTAAPEAKAAGAGVMPTVAPAGFASNPARAGLAATGERP
ncbi:MAG: hypothetical protein HY985_02400 [Magnetospirillum sp.]|nr:hypothetical protein [Magnetospirillum sp.]